MSKYFIEDTTLTDIADQLRLELDTTLTYNPEDMPLAIHLAASQGGGGGYELVATQSKDIPLADTNWSSLTWSTSAKTLYAAQTNFFDITLPTTVDMADHEMLVLVEAGCTYKFATQPSPPYCIRAAHVQGFIYSQAKSPSGTPTDHTYNNALYSSNYTFIRGVYTTDGTSLKGSAGHNGGVILGVGTCTFVQSNHVVSGVRYTTPAITGKYNNSYMPLAAIEAVDVMNTVINYKISIYKTPKGITSAALTSANNIDFNMED